MEAIRAVIPAALEGDRWYAAEMRLALDLVRSGAVDDAGTGTGADKRSNGPPVIALSGAPRCAPVRRYRRLRP